MTTLATHVATILAGLRVAIAASAALRYANPALAARSQARSALLVRVWSYLGRTAARLDRLLARFHAGTLPKPRPTRPTTTRKPAPPQPRLPTTQSWLVATIGYTAAGHASQLNHLLARPDLAPFLQAAPQAGRLLRPLCRMLGITPPPPLILPPRPRKPRAPTPAQPPRPPTARAPTVRHGKYTPAAIRRYRPGPIPRPLARPA